MNLSLDRWMDGWMDVWLDGLLHEWTDIAAIYHSKGCSYLRKHPA